MRTDGRILGKRVSPEPGLACAVCDKPIGPDDYVFLVEGQRVAVHRSNCYQKLLHDPYRYINFLRPNGAFLGSGTENAAVGFVWFFVGVYILTGLLFAALSAHQALHRGRSAFRWFGVGLALNFLGYLLLLTRPRRSAPGAAGIAPGLQKFHATRESMPCAGCGKANHPSAEQCAGCGAQLQPLAESETRKIGLRDS